MIKYIRQHIWLAAVRLGLTNRLSDQNFARLLHFFWLGRKMRENPPVDFNEKLQWLKVHYRHPLMPMCADKYGVREYVKEKIGDKYLNECIGVYDNVEEIDFKILPNRFVMKCTHGSSWNLVCKDKSKIDWGREKKRLRRWLGIDFSHYGREWQYHAIKPRIICERFLEDASCDDLMDFKLFTFRGETKYIWVEFKKNGQYLRNIYSPEWVFQPGKGNRIPTGNGEEIPRPECLDEMINQARALASQFPQCRVDFYIINGRKIVFGELTFTSGNGCNEFYPQSFADELGKCIDLDSIEKEYLK